MSRDEAPPDAHPPFVINPRRKLFEAAATATNARMLLIASAGLALFLLLGRDVDNVFRTPSTADADFAPGLVFGRGPGVVLRAAFARAAEPAVRLVRPFIRLFSYEISLGGRLRALLQALLGVAIWGIFGGALARVAVVRAARGEWLGIRPALLFALKRWRPLIGAPLAPLVAVGFFAAISAGFGALFRLGWIGRELGGALLVVPLALSTLNAVIVLGLTFAWPLMHVTIAAESEDGFDAVSRSFAYVTQRKALFAALALGAWVIGAVGAVAAELFARLVVHLTSWSLALGGSEAAYNAVAAPSSAGAGFWLGLVLLLVQAWSWAFFWAAAAALYLIVRFDVDGAPWFDVAPSSPRAEPAAAPPEAPAAADADLTVVAVPKPATPLPDTDEFQNHEG